jgi:hypothetical protein
LAPEITTVSKPKIKPARAAIRDIPNRLPERFTCIGEEATSLVNCIWKHLKIRWKLLHLMSGLYSQFFFCESNGFLSELIKWIELSIKTPITILNPLHS